MKPDRSTHSHGAVILHGRFPQRPPPELEKQPPAPGLHTTPPRDHNSRNATISIEVRLFNSLSYFADEGTLSRQMTVAPGTTIGDIIRTLGIPASKVFLALKNGRDVSPGIYAGGTVNESVTVDDGDVIAFSGPVPYSYGYGAPIV